MLSLTAVTTTLLVCRFVYIRLEIGVYEFCITKALCFHGFYLCLYRFTLILTCNQLLFRLGLIELFSLLRTVYSSFLYLYPLVNKITMMLILWSKINNCNCMLFLFFYNVNKACSVS